MSEKVLIVSSLEKDSEKLSRLFHSYDMETTIVGYASKARRKLLENDFSLIVVNTPLSDEFGTEFAINAAEKTYAGILLFVKAGLFATTVEKAEQSGVFVLEKPLTAPLNEIIRLMRAMSFRMTSARRENEKLIKKIADMRTVERAKIALIQYENMSEEEAHRFIEKQAMDKRVGRGEIAAEILKRFGD